MCFIGTAQHDLNNVVHFTTSYFCVLNSNLLNIKEFTLSMMHTEYLFYFLVTVSYAIYFTYRVLASKIFKRPDIRKNTEVSSLIKSILPSIQFYDVYRERGKQRCKMLTFFKKCFGIYFTETMQNDL